MIAGIFVGGSGIRMGGVAKGRLPAPDTGEPLLVRTSRLLSELGLTCVLVGKADAYADLAPELTRLDDLPRGVGPLGGLAALLSGADDAHVVTLACDMPFVSRALLAKLIAESTDADIVAPRGSGGFWEPLCARYRVATVAPELTRVLAAGERSFRALFARLNVHELALSTLERSELRDWDTKEDVNDA